MIPMLFCLSEFLTTENVNETIYLVKRRNTGDCSFIFKLRVNP